MTKKELDKMISDSLNKSIESRVKTSLREEHDPKMQLIDNILTNVLQRYVRNSKELNEIVDAFMTAIKGKI